MPSMFTSLGDLTNRETLVRAPLVLDPLMARLAEEAGFEAVYLGGGGLGYAKTFLEANLNVSEMAQAGMDIASVTRLPIILDGACGWGDPMHLQRTIALAETAGFAAIELEDQVFPKRASHHVGEDHTVPMELMEAKIRSAVEARRDERFLVIARTNVAASEDDPEEATRRCEAYRRAGADVLLPATGSVRDPQVIVDLGEQLGPPLMFLAAPGGLAHAELTADDLHRAGYRILTDAMSLQLLVYETLKAGYAELARDGFAIAPDRAPAEWWGILGDLHETIGLERLLAVERGDSAA
jgi:2-methylisocitrate lyase-like PEP mutase family enzyme